MSLSLQTRIYRWPGRCFIWIFNTTQTHFKLNSVFFLFWSYFLLPFSKLVILIRTYSDFQNEKPQGQTGYLFWLLLFTSLLFGYDASILSYLDYCNSLINDWYGVSLNCIVVMPFAITYKPWNLQALTKKFILCSCKVQWEMAFVSCTHSVTQMRNISSKHFWRLTLT